MTTETTGPSGSQAHPAVGPCPCCGAYSLQFESQTSALFAVCDVLVIHALEKVGKWVVRADRARFSAMRGRPFYLAHTIWLPDRRAIEKSLNGAWDVVPAMLNVHGCCGISSESVTRMLDEYVQDLLITGTGHRVQELVYRFQSRLGVPVPAGSWGQTESLPGGVG